MYNRTVSLSLAVSRCFIHSLSLSIFHSTVLCPPAASWNWKLKVHTMVLPLWVLLTCISYAQRIFQYFACTSTHTQQQCADSCACKCVCESKNMHMLAHRQPHKHLTARLANKHSIIAYFCASSSQNGVVLFAPSQQELQSLPLFCSVLCFLFSHTALAPCSARRTWLDVAFGNVIEEYFGEV